MNLLEKVGESVKPFPFILNYFLRTNETLNTRKFPLVIINRNPNSQLINRSGNLCEQTDFLIFFIQKTTKDRYSIENEKLINEMNKLALGFLRKVRKENVLSIIGEVRLSKLYDYKDANVTGVGLSITLRENFGNIEKK